MTGNMKAKIKVAIADDHPMIRAAAKLALERCGDIEVVGTAQDSTALIALLERVDCDVLVTDLAMPGGAYGDGLSFIGYCQRNYPRLRIVVLTGTETPGLLKLLQDSGVSGVLTKSDEAEHTVQAVTAVFNGSRYLGPKARKSFESVGLTGRESGSTAALSKREFEVVRLFVNGLTIKEIANRLNRSVKTISTQKVCAMQKLALRRDAELHQYAQINGLVNLPSADAPAHPDDDGRE